MSRTLTEKIMGRLAGRSVSAGDMIEIGSDWTFALDDGIGLIDQNFKRYGVQKLAHPERIRLFYDHYAPADTPLHALMHKIGRKLFDKFNIPREYLHDVGAGISHQIAVESGLVHPGSMVTNMDSHTITIGAVGAIGCGIGGAEMAYLWSEGKLWFRVPETIKIELNERIAAGLYAGTNFRRTRNANPRRSYCHHTWLWRLCRHASRCFSRRGSLHFFFEPKLSWSHGASRCFSVSGFSRNGSG